MATFQSYLDTLNSSTACCRSASLLIPTTNRKANDVLKQLREWQWICESVLVRPWASRDVSPDDHHYFECLPTEEELLFLQQKFASSIPSPLPFPSAPTSVPSSSLREATRKRHVDAKSLIVPLTDDATAFILRVLFTTPMSCASDADRCQKRIVIENWIASNAVTIVHNCDGNQVVSLSKEVDSFPRPSLPIDGNRKATSKCFTFVDIFAGIGGFRVGMEILGGICIGSCEIDPYARDNYRHNFNKDESRCNAGSEFFVNDITRLEMYPDTVDVICGGFPCQSFSTLASFATNNKSDDGSAQHALEGTNSIEQRRQGGLDTPKKGALFFHLLRILRTSLPKIFVFENVKGLMKVDSGRHLDRILNLLEESGYNVSHTMIDTSWFLPQRRERIYFVGIRLDLLRNESSESLIRFKQLDVDLRKKYQIYGNDIKRADITDKCDRDNIANQSLSPLNTSQSLPPSCLGDVLESHESVCRYHSQCFLTTSQWEKLCKQGYIQLHADGSGQLLTDSDPCCQTLVSSYRQSFLLHSQFVVPRDSLYLMRQKEQLSIATARKNKGGRGIIEQETASVVTESKNPTLPRFFTPRECCRLQGFPESFWIGDCSQRRVVSHFYRQIGNAASPPCVAAAGELAVSSFLIPCTGDQDGIYHEMRTSRINSPVFELILNASPQREKIRAIIERNQSSLTFC